MIATTSMSLRLDSAMARRDVATDAAKSVDRYPNRHSWYSFSHISQAARADRRSMFMWSGRGNAPAVMPRVSPMRTATGARQRLMPPRRALCRNACRDRWCGALAPNELHADEDAVGADDSSPSPCVSPASIADLDRRCRRRCRRDRRRAGPGEQVHAGDRHHARRVAAFVQRAFAWPSTAISTSEPEANRDHFAASPLAACNLIGAAGAQIVGMVEFAAQLRGRLLARQGEHARGRTLPPAPAASIPRFRLCRPGGSTLRLGIALRLARCSTG